MIAIWTVGLIAGMVAAALASRRAVVAALTAGEVAHVSPAFIGVTVMAVGTDLPEIANSIIAAWTGHGDVNVGDSAGSALTQVTFVLAVVCFLAAPVRSTSRVVIALGAATAAALALDALLVNDGSFGRSDGLLVVSIWLVSLAVFGRLRTPPAGDVGPTRWNAAPHVAMTIVWLAVVGLAATIVVRSFVALTDALGIPELVASAIVLALGTSLPELVVDITALRRGAIALALGDLFGSSFVDATLAIGSGPLLRATDVSPDATAACLVAAAGVLAATVVMGARSTHGRSSAAALLVVYLAATAALVVTTG